MSSDLAVSVRGLGKDYRIRHGLRSSSVAEELTSALRRRRGTSSVETFSALRDVSFDVARGDVVGIIGRNGAGKSTLLKILSRITDPSAGEVALYGSVGALLEVGSGFHPELTGRENVFLNGAMLGLGRREVSRLFDEIVAFAEVERFIDTPVKRYSSGMYVRLAFAVAAHVLPEILIIDEVLAVGDTNFQKKCLGKMGDAARSGRTVLFVSHNMQVINALCTTAVLLKGGVVKSTGRVESVVREYQAATATAGDVSANFAPVSETLALRSARVHQDADEGALLSSRPTIVDMCISTTGLSMGDLACGFWLLDQYGNRILSSFYNDLDEHDSSADARGWLAIRCTIPAHTFNEGVHRLVFGLAIHKVEGFTKDDVHVLDFEIINIDGVGARFGLGRSWRDEPLLPAFNWTVTPADLSRVTHTGHDHLAP